MSCTFKECPFSVTLVSPHFLLFFLNPTLQWLSRYLKLPFVFLFCFLFLLLYFIFISFQVPTIFNFFSFFNYFIFLLFYFIFFIHLFNSFFFAKPKKYFHFSKFDFCFYQKHICISNYCDFFSLAFFLIKINFYEFKILLIFLPLQLILLKPKLVIQIMGKTLYLLKNFSILKLI